MRWRPSIPLLACVAAAAVVVPPTGAQAAGGGNVAATQRYVQANYALVKGAAARIGPAEAALRRLQGQIKGECPRVAENAPQDEDSEKLSYEVIGAEVYAAYRTGFQLGVSFIKATEGLRWSNGALTSQIQSYVGKLRALSKLTNPHVCDDIRAWVASGYKTLPEATVRFDAVFIPSWVGIGELPPQMSRYESGATAGLVRKSHQFEEQITEVEVHIGVTTYEQLLDALVLPP